MLGSSSWNTSSRSARRIRVQEALTGTWSSTVAERTRNSSEDIRPSRRR
ncbi:hypothetical protein [Streptomyces sp. NPDC059708]